MWWMTCRALVHDVLDDVASTSTDVVDDAAGTRTPITWWTTWRAQVHGVMENNRRSPHLDDVYGFRV